MKKRRSRFIEETGADESNANESRVISDESSKKPLVPDPKIGPRIEKDSDVRRRDQLYLLQSLFIKNVQTPKPKASSIHRRPLILGSRKKAHNEVQRSKGGRPLHKPLEYTPDMDPKDNYKLKNSSQYSLYMRKDPQAPGPVSQQPISLVKKTDQVQERPETPPVESADIVEDYLRMTPISPFKAPDLSDRETFKYWSKDPSPRKMSTSKGEEPLKTTIQTNAFFRKISGRQHKSPKKPARVGIRSSIAFRKSPSMNIELAKVEEQLTPVVFKLEESSTSNKPRPSHRISPQEAHSSTQGSPSRTTGLRDSEALSKQGSPCSTISATVESARSASLIAAKASHVNILYAADAPKLPFPSPPPTTALPRPPTSQISPVREHKKSGSFNYHPFPKTSPKRSPQKSPGKRTKFVKEAIAQASAGAVMAESRSAPLLSETHGSLAPEIARKPSLEPSPIPDSPLMNNKQSSRMNGGDVVTSPSACQIKRQRKTEAKKRRDMAIHRAWLASCDIETVGGNQAVTGGQAYRSCAEVPHPRQGYTANTLRDQEEIIHLSSTRDSHDNPHYVNAQGVSGYQSSEMTPEPLRLEKSPTPTKTPQSNRKSRVIVLAEQPPLIIPVTQSPEDVNANIHLLYRNEAASQRRVSPLNPLAPPFVANHRSLKQCDLSNGHLSPGPTFATSHALRRDFSVRSAHSLPTDPRDYSPRNSFNSLVAENRDVRLSAVERAVERNSFLLEKVLVAALEENTILKGRVRKESKGIGERLGYDGEQMGTLLGQPLVNGHGLDGRDLNGGENLEKAYL